MSKKRLKARQMPDIGELRAHLEHRRDSQGWALVRAWAELAWEADPVQFDEVWLRYLSDHLSRWPAQVCDAPLGWIKRLASSRAPFGPMRLVRHIRLDGRADGSFNMLYALADRAELSAVELSSVELLSARGVMASETVMERLCAEGRLPALRELSVGGLSMCGGDALFNSPLMAQLEALFIGGLMPGSEAAPRRVEGALPRLKQLGLPGFVSPQGAVRWLAARFEAGALGSLEVIDLRDASLCREPDDWALFSPLGAPLREVHLTGARMLGAPRLFEVFGPRLEVLALGGAQVDAAQRLIGDALMIPPLIAQPAPALRRRDLSRSNVTWRTIEAIRQHRALPALEALELSGGLLIGQDAVEELCKISHTERLRELDLPLQGITERAAHALARWPLLANLTRLGLHGAGHHTIADHRASVVEIIKASPYFHEGLAVG